jgi:iron complex transport system substrate-binding protein
MGRGNCCNDVVRLVCVTQNGRCLVLILNVVFCVVACSDNGSAANPELPDLGRDDAGLRLVTLSPHLAELAWLVGAGHLLVGVSAYTDYPEEVTQLPAVGDAFSLDLERLAILQPDLLLAWQSGTPAHIVDELQERGYRVETVKTENVADVSVALRQIGGLTGFEENAARVADQFSANMANLAQNYESAESISVFYQVSRRPLYTINDAHYVSDLISICGARNVFADLGKLAPLIGVEAVLERDPEVLFASGDAGKDAFEDWGRWPDLAANRYANRFIMPANEIGRATPRLLIAAKAMCEALDQARTNREAANNQQ